MESTLQSELDELIADTRTLLQAEQARGVRGFPLKDFAAKTVAQENPAVSSGPATAPVLVVGQSEPGAHSAGLPDGEAGEMLSKMLEHVVGISAESVHFLNVPRMDKAQQIPGFLAQLEATLQAVQPKVVLVLGQSAAWAAMGADAELTACRGQWIELLGVPAVPTYHPQFLLAQPEFKRLVFRDLKGVRQRLSAVGASA
jgi:DNA polymerase